MKNVRKVINEVMNDVLVKNINLKVAMDQRIKDGGLKGPDVGLVKEEVYGTIRNLNRINYVIYKYNNIKKVDYDVLNLLRTSTYEILFLDKIPEHATCNEAVNLTKSLKKKSAANFVNAVLRNIVRSKQVIEYPLKEDDIVEYLSVYYSMPKWLCEMLLDTYPVNELEKMFAKMNEESDITLLTNTVYVSKDDLKNALVNNGYEVNDGLYIKEALRLKNMPSMTTLKEYKKGLFYVQDESSMLASKILGAKVGEKILDVCASPGGKSIYSDIISGDTLRIDACDKSNDKVKTIKENVKRLRLNGIKPCVCDGTKFDESKFERYDKLIIDAPCSGIGLLSKKPDIKLNATQMTVEELQSLQREIFDNAIKYLKVGGELIYTTCTISKKENEENLKYFLENENYEVEMVSIKDLLPEGIKEDGTGYVQLLPHIHNTDGFFISKMKKLK
ncbi:MAG: 16S rRNA (cytosine(967)-C(5))-methyltransferase RsmB [Clostridia bacterium]|nr:16S rRNA (cytosine(967)-C(5))-methyltransferase RsmB [Clostridia bacterium]